MAIELTLGQTDASGPLLPARFALSLATLAKLSAITGGPHGTMVGQELRLALELPLDDGACAAFLLEFPGQGRRVKGAAHGPSAALLAWGLHTLAHAMKCTLTDDEGNELTPAPNAFLEAAVVYLTTHEGDVEEARSKLTDVDTSGGALLAWLVREEHVVLAGDSAALADALPMGDAEALYALLLESDAVEDVFISERELGSLLSRFKARTPR